ncbi:MAG: FIST N-terminal domain-containing protein [Cyanobacteria bacterium P01_E01_bin.34]
MQWVNALSTNPSLEAALTEVVSAATAQLQDVNKSPVPQLTAIDVDLALIFVSAAFASEYSRIALLLKGMLPSGTDTIGCSGGGIMGNSQEIEDKPAISLVLAKLPGVEVQLFHIAGDGLPDADSPPDRWLQVLGMAGGENPHFILLADAFSSNITELLQGLDFAFPSATTVGGLASGAQAPNGNALFLNGEMHRDGAVGVALSGNISVEAIVAQGCRPIGMTMQVSRAERNVVLQLDQRPPLVALQDIVKSLSETDRQLVRTSLFAGMVMDEFKETPEPGDFLIRNIIGIDPRTGALAVGDRLRSGQRLQFHLRDKQTSDEDLHAVLRRYRQERMERGLALVPAGALMFSCLGRGEYLYGEPNHDTQVLEESLGAVPMGGFFCNGEIGPVGGATFLHGYTSVFALFNPLTAQ